MPITLDTRCKKQEIRLSSGDIKILPKDHDSILFLESNLLLLPNVERRMKNVEFGKLVF